ncbi:MAG: SMC-Scp complex subunit ScpB [Bacteroidota bacterium]
MDPHISNIIESIIFTAEHPVKPDFLLTSLKPREDGNAEDKAASLVLTKEQLQEILDALIEKYKDDRYPFEIRHIAEGYQFFTKKTYFPFVKKASLQKNKKRLSKAALETLSIVAYRQPITKSELEFIRGVNCDYAVQKLLEKQLLSILGRADAPGRPLLYGCSPYFMQYFGMKDMSDLPKLKEFEELEEEHLELFRQHQLEKKEESNEQAKSAETGQESEAEENGETLLEGGGPEETQAPEEQAGD